MENWQVDLGRFQWWLCKSKGRIHWTNSFNAHWWGKGMTRFTTSKRGQVALGLYTYKPCFALYWLGAWKSIPWGTEGKEDHFFLVCSECFWDKLSPCCSNSSCPQMLATPLKWNAISQLTPSRLKMITVAFTKEAMMIGKKIFLEFISNPVIKDRQSFPYL